MSEPNTMAHTCNLEAQEARAVGYLTWGKHGLCSEFGASQDNITKPFLKENPNKETKKKKKNTGRSWEIPVHKRHEKSLMLFWLLATLSFSV